jgi:hypothetical protein
MRTGAGRAVDSVRRAFLLARPRCATQSAHVGGCSSSPHIFDLTNPCVRAPRHRPPPLIPTARGHRRLRLKRPPQAALSPNPERRWERWSRGEPMRERARPPEASEYPHEEPWQTRDQALSSSSWRPKNIIRAGARCSKRRRSPRQPERTSARRRAESGVRTRLEPRKSHSRYQVAAWSISRSAAARILCFTQTDGVDETSSESIHHDRAVFFSARFFAITSIELLEHPLGERPLVHFHRFELVGMLRRVLRLRLGELGAKRSPTRFALGGEREAQRLGDGEHGETCASARPPRSTALARSSRPLHPRVRRPREPWYGSPGHQRRAAPW